MYLKSLELQGFKSFPDKTKLTFEGGTTIIVGPNGSGKSNISDAMRWVLGEISSKSIRGTKMEDIIFVGSDSRRPMGFAEVSVTFDNNDNENRLDSPYDEVTVTRRYYRAGDSEYFINRKPVRLRDIYELFMNTGIGRDGYSIIGQGKIAEIISRKSDERRSIFEDAAGIAKYRSKKTETERKLEQTEENMVRVNDVFSEVEAQVGPLEKEAEKAKRALTLLEDKKKADVQLWLYDTEKSGAEIAQTDEAYRRAAFDLQNAEEALADYERQNDRLFEASQSNKLASEELYKQIKEQTTANHNLESEFKVNEANIAHTRELITAAEAVIANAETSCNDELVTKTARAEGLEKLREQLATERENYTAAQNEQSEAAVSAAAIAEELESSLDELRRLESEETDVRVRINVLENANINDTGKNSSIATEIESYEKISDDLTAQCAERQTVIESYTASEKKTETEAAEAAAALDELNKKTETANCELSRLRFRRDSIAQRIETYRVMEEQFEGYNNSVKFVMKQYAEGRITDPNGVRCAKIYGPLSRVISVDDAYITAVETALGANLQHIVVADESAAKAAMYCLKQAQAGRATFFPLTSMSPSTMTAEVRAAAGYRGFVAVADTLVKCDERFSGVVSNLLGRTVIFDNIDNATAMARSQSFRVRAVTLDGQQINVGGSFTGGSTKTRNGILGRAGEIKNLEAELVGLKSDIDDSEAEFEKLRRAAEKLTAERNAADDKIKLINTLKNNESNRLEQLRAKLEANITLTEKLRSDADELGQTRAKNEEDIRILTENATELKRKIGELSARRSERDIERNAYISERDRLGERITGLFIKISSIEKDIETGTTLIESSDATMEKSHAEIGIQRERISQLTAHVNELTAACDENRKRYTEGDKQLTGLNAKRAALEEDSFEFERKLNAMNAKTRAKNNEKDLIFREYTKYENKLAALRDTQDKLANKLMEEHGLTRGEALALGYPALGDDNIGDARKIQIDCRNKLRAIGNVDLDAVEKYKELKSRYDYMKEQIEDLTKSKQELEGILNRIDREMKVTFVEAFDKINTNFNRVFCELFGGGSAELSLTEPEDVLNSGIEIKAAPPGKIIKSLMQLSGGEQSFIAIALFFAIIQVNPTPFCILDEIEAALDEVNVARFAEYIKRYSDGTQFVIITHRRGTMEAANRLYGVTMPEHGISKVLELDVSDLKKKKGDGWDEIFG